MTSDDYMLPDTMVYEVRREDDGAFIGVMHTRSTANGLLDQYERDWNEKCYVAESYINNKPQSLADRVANDLDDII